MSVNSRNYGLSEASSHGTSNFLFGAGISGSEKAAARYRNFVGPAAILVIEDSREGIKGARRAGMRCLAVTNTHPAELLGEANAGEIAFRPVSDDPKIGKTIQPT